MGLDCGKPDQEEVPTYNLLSSSFEKGLLNYRQKLLNKINMSKQGKYEYICT
jgi:hypothetical protein